MDERLALHPRQRVLHFETTSGARKPCAQLAGANRGGRGVSQWWWVANCCDGR
jgi:hypothetical protein